MADMKAMNSVKEAEKENVLGPTDIEMFAFTLV